MIKNENTNIAQAKAAYEEIKLFRAREAAKTDAQKEREASERSTLDVKMGKKSHTFRPESGKREEQECRYCHERGHSIKKGGQLTCPKLLAKEKYKSQQIANRQRRNRAEESNWSRGIQDASGCDSRGGSRSGNSMSFEEQQKRMQRSREQTTIIRNTVRNPYDMSDEEDDIPTIVQPKTIATSNPWSKGAPKDQEESKRVLEEVNADMEKHAEPLAPQVTQRSIEREMNRVNRADRQPMSAFFTPPSIRAAFSAWGDYEDTDVPIWGREDSQDFKDD